VSIFVTVLYFAYDFFEIILF